MAIASAVPRPFGAMFFPDVSGLRPCRRIIITGILVSTLLLVRPLPVISCRRRRRRRLNGGSCVRTRHRGWWWLSWLSYWRRRFSFLDRRWRVGCGFARRDLVGCCCPSHRRAHGQRRLLRRIRICIVSSAPFRPPLSLVGSFHSLALALVFIVWLLRASAARYRSTCPRLRLRNAIAHAR